jgi:hypothetical protein
VSDKDSKELIYPNPGHGQFTIPGHGRDIRMYDLFGNRVDFKVDGSEINMVNAIPGMYLVSFKMNDRRFVEKIVVD